MTSHLSALLAAFDSMHVESVSVRIWSPSDKPEHIVTIDAGTADRVYAVALELGAPFPVDKMADGKTWLSTRIERDGLTINIIGAWRVARAA